MQWRTFRHSGIDEDVKFWDAKTGETCTLFDCMESGNFEEEIVSHRIHIPRSFGFYAELDCGGYGEVLFTEYKEKFLKCSKCDRKHTLKKQRKWNNTQRNKSEFNRIVDRLKLDSLGKLSMEEIHEMIKEMEE
jgi:hypothetical protein